MIKDKRIDSLIDALSPTFAKFPHLPKGAIDVLVSIAPWLALIFGALGIVGVLSGIAGLIGVSSIAMMYASVVGTILSGISIWVIFPLLFSLVASVLELLAYPGLRDRKAAGWRYMFVSQTVAILGFLVSMNIVPVVLSFLIGYYILFELKSSYK